MSRTAGVDGVVLTHGAGSDRNHASLVALERGLDVPVERLDFPYRREGRRAPDRAPKLLAFLAAEVPEIARRWNTSTDRLVLGGRSMGGRMCSMLVAEGLAAAGLVLVSYPLHPPGKPDKLRVEHFGELRVPCLFVSGDRDPFGTPDELANYAADVPGPVTLSTLAGRHDLKGREDEIVDVVRSWLAGLATAS